MIDKENLKILISDIFNYIENKEEIFRNKVFKGHPGLYYFHNKKDLQNKIDDLLNKTYYDKYDLFYIINYLIKYMLDKYDSHTKISFNDEKYLPIDVKIIDNKTYIIYASNKYNEYKYKEIIKINNISINEIYKEIEKIVGYSTKEYLKSYEEAFITSYDRLRSLPNIDRTKEEFTLTFKDNTYINLKYGEYQNINYPNIKENYSYEVINNNIIYIIYNSCKDIDKMNNLIKNIKIISKEKNIKNYIIDLRNNRGGDSSIIKPLLDYLSNKNIVTLINEQVFSSGTMALINLVNIGSYVIGTDISTSINHFGNVPGEYNIKEFNMKVKRSSSYWYYDNNYNCKMYDKDTFINNFKDKKELLEPILIHPDMYSYLNLDDYINKTDKQLNDAVKYLENFK